MDREELWNSIMEHMKEKFPKKEQAKTSSEEQEFYTPEEVILSFIKDPEDHKVALQCFEQMAYFQRGNVVHIEEQVGALAYILGMIQGERDFKVLRPLLIRELNGIQNYVTDVWNLDNYRHEDH